MNENLNETQINLIEYAKNAFEKARDGMSNLDADILNIKTMTGTHNRHLYNNVCSMPDTKYMEIGSWYGSSICAAMYKNNMECLCIENFSQFCKDGTKKRFLEFFEKYKGTNNAKFLEEDCWEINPESLDRYNVYMYNARMTNDFNYKALTHYFKCLEHNFIYIVNDWNFENVRNQTYKAIKDKKAKILWKDEIIIGGNNFRANDEKWWNGIAIFVIEKRANRRRRTKTSLRKKVLSGR